MATTDSTTDPAPLNPYAAPITAKLLKPAKPVKPRGRGMLVFARLWTGLMILGAPAAATAAYMDIESILVSGPIYAVASLVLLGLVLLRRVYYFLPIAIATLAFVLGVLLTIMTLSWSPAQAQIPISLACAAFAIVLQLGWFAVGYSAPSSDAH